MFILPSSSSNNIIFDLKRHPTLHYLTLDDAGASINNEVVLVPVAPVPGPQDVEVLEFAIDGLMPCHGILFHPPPLKFTLIVAGLANLVAIVALIRFSKLSNRQRFTQGELEDFPVWKITTWVWPIHPNNPPSLDADAHLVPQTWPVKLMTEP